jgi:glyoxylase-like metal-dependent hydrolase (beta-lactamase superfamily II)
MPDDILELADRLWRGEVTTGEYHPVTHRRGLAEVCDGAAFLLRHEKGETDDHTVTWLADRQVLCCGDLFIWASPNAGNPQKVQRYPREWAGALRRMAGLGAEYLLPGHGLPVIGADRVRQALGDTAALLEALVDQTLEVRTAAAAWTTRSTPCGRPPTWKPGRICGRCMTSPSSSSADPNMAAGTRQRRMDRRLPGSGGPCPSSTRTCCVTTR